MYRRRLLQMAMGLPAMALTDLPNPDPPNPDPPNPDLHEPTTRLIQRYPTTAPAKLLTVDERLERIRKADRGKPRRQVTILGAGMAGLAAAYELESLGHKVRILEGSKRVGGRVFTHYFEEPPPGSIARDGTYGELGPMRIPIHHDYTHHYIRLLGLQLRPFINAHSHREGFYDISGEPMRIREAPTRLYPLFGLSRMQQNDPIPPQMLGRTISDTVEGLTEKERHSLLTAELATDRLRQLDQMTLGEYLRLRAGESAAELVGLSTGLESFFDRAVTNFIRDAVLEEGDRLDEIVGGMSRLPNALANRLHAKPEFEMRVTGIRASANGKINIDISHAGNPQTVSADLVICTLPFTVLRKINIVPPFSVEKMAAIRDLSYVSSTKVLLWCRERFWEEQYGIFGGASISDGVTRQTYYPSDNVAAEIPPQPTVRYSTIYGGYTGDGLRQRDKSIGNRPGVLLGSYTWAEDARRLGALSPTERRDTVIQGIARFHPEIARKGMVLGHASMFWDAFSWTSGGAFSLLKPGDQSMHYANAIRHEGNIFFAGEHCSLDNGWIQGALVSALRTVEEIVS